MRLLLPLLIVVASNRYLPAEDFASLGRRISDIKRFVQGGETLPAAEEIQSLKAAYRRAAAEGLDRDRLRRGLDAVRELQFAVELDGVVLPAIYEDQWLGDVPAKSDPTPPVGPVSNAEPISAAPSDASPEVAEVSFGRHVAPILLENCVGCHIDTDRPRADLDLSSLASMVDAGVVESGDGESSLLVQRIRGIGGDRMPGGGRPPLKDDQIQLIARWIDSGASPGSVSPSAPLRRAVDAAWSADATPEDVAEKRDELTRQQVRLTFGDVGDVNRLETERWIVVGRVDADVLRGVGEALEEATDTATKIIPGDEPYFGARAVAHVLPGGYDYGEFVRMVQSRTPGGGERWTIDAAGASAYVAASADVATESVVAPVHALALATRGEVPTWLAEGFGEAAEVAAIRDRATKKRRVEEINTAWRTMSSPEQLFDGSLPPEQSRQIGAAVAMKMVARPNRAGWTRFLEALRRNVPFEEAFETGYRSTPQEFVR